MNGIKRAAQAIGGMTNLANKLDLSVPAISRWAASGRPPIERCVLIERITGVSRRELRPDVWGDMWPELIDAEHPWPVPSVDCEQAG